MSYYGQLYNETLASTNCTTLSCLRQLPTSTINALFARRPNAWSNPIIDNNVLFRLPSDSLRTHQFARVPLLVGSTSDEATFFTPTNINSTAEFRAYLSTADAGANYSPATINKFLVLYPDDPVNQLPESYTLDPAEVGTQYKRAVTWNSDRLFIAGRRATAEAYVAARQKVWSYRFDAVIPGGLGPRYGAHHAGDLRFFFGTPDQSIPEEYLPLVEEMRGRLGAFVRGETPQGELTWF
jgi:carboxylesterase type B